MKKKILAVALGITLCLSIVGCGENDTKGLSSSVNAYLEEKILGVEICDNIIFIPIGGWLFYDSTTNIVYILNSELRGGVSPYYAPNGLPYKYNPETNEFCEIEK